MSSQEEVVNSNNEQHNFDQQPAGDAELLSPLTRLLHIIIALGMIGLVGVGIYMTDFEVYALYDLHKAFGAILLVFILARVYWRICEGWPSPLAGTPAWQQQIAKLVHWVLLITTVLFPISGLMMSIGGGHGLSIFGWELVAENMDAAGNTLALNESAAGLGKNIHGILRDVILITLALHVGGALKHHIIDKDNTLKRMFTFKS